MSLSCINCYLLLKSPASYVTLVPLNQQMELCCMWMSIIKEMALCWNTFSFKNTCNHVKLTEDKKVSIIDCISLNMIRKIRWSYNYWLETSQIPCFSALVNIMCCLLHVCLFVSKLSSLAKQYYFLNSQIEVYLWKCFIYLLLILIDISVKCILCLY